jgi:glutamate 5-kinase
VLKEETDTHLGKALQDATRIVIKLGTNIVAGDGSEFCLPHLRPIADSIARLKQEGRQVILVSSGAVGLGAGKLSLPRARLSDLATRQACAAVGQSLLMHAYEQLFRTHNVSIAQVLLTEDDFVDWKRHFNLRRTIEKLLKLEVLPVINENDTVSTVELEYGKTEQAGHTFGDNDRLAALVMSKVDADALIILTNVDGLLRQAPKLSGTSEPSESLAVVRLVTEITPELKAMAQGCSTAGRGGMLTKLEAAEIAMQTGGIAVIANGSNPEALDRLFSGEHIGTAFVSRERVKGKRRWIAHAAKVQGRLVVNAGARAALLQGKASLLASGVIRIEDQFESMDVVSIVDDSGREFARGISNCASSEAEDLVSRAAGGVKARVLVTRDNIVLMER